MLTGDSGILNRAGQAKELNEIAQIKEQAELIKSNLLIKKLGVVPKRSELINDILVDDFFKGSKKNGSTTVTTANEKYDIIIDNKLNIKVILHESGALVEDLEAGLYDIETMDLKMSWKDLTKSDGPIVVQNGIVSTHYDSTTNTNSSAEILDGQIVFPDTITGFADNAFRKCDKLAGDIIIPDSVNSIGYAAIMDCTSLKGKVLIPNSVQTIGFSVLSNTGPLESVEIDITTIPSGFGPSCSLKTKDLIIGDNVTTVEKYAFGGCSGITGNLTIGESVTTIGNQAFSGCSGITGDIVLPDSVKTIEEAAFVGLVGIQLCVPMNIETIGNNAFGSVSVVYYDGELEDSSNWGAIKLIRKVRELTTEEIAQLPNSQYLLNNTRLKAVLKGGIPVTTEMTYVVGDINSGAVVSIDGNEFVWVPVPDVISTNTSLISTESVDLAKNTSTVRPMAKQNGTEYEGLLYDFNGTTSTYKPTWNIATNNSESREPALLTYIEYTQDYINFLSNQGITALRPSENEIKSEYKDMVTSVDKYKGFYVARYELGLQGDNPVSKKAETNSGVITANGNNSKTKSWYGLYEKCKSMYNQSSQNIVSQMIWGSQYDAMMNWMAKTGNTIGTPNRNKWGSNHKTTGTENSDITNNVYDLYGCYAEWTQEAIKSDVRTSRGGIYDYDNFAPSVRFSSSNYPSNNSLSENSRPTLYIK